MKKNYLLLLLLIITSCSKNKEKHPYTFYYWKTRLALKPEEKSALQKSKTEVLYTRFFDIDKISNKFQPVGIITKDSTFITSKTIVPVVFITNRTFLNIKNNEIKLLAESTNKLLEEKIKKYQLKTSNEIQIDCDWTAGTKNDYFEYLQKLKEISKKNITSTLRLHQVKDKNTMGIPPVEKVYLMCYSTSSPLENSNKNSILDNQTLKKYLSKLDDYPIKNMDIALPIYSWGIITNHLGKHKLINGISTKDLDNQNFRKIKENEVIIKKDGFYFGFYLNKGFKIKAEEIPSSQLDDAVNFLNKKLNTFTIIYYQLDQKFIQNKNFN